MCFLNFGFVGIEGAAARQCPPPLGAPPPKIAVNTAQVLDLITAQYSKNAAFRTPVVFPATTCGYRHRQPPHIAFI
jgi:hypothetical protein